MRVAYLVGRYPAISHAFLEREVRGLRDSGGGFEVETISIRPALGEDLLTEADREEAARTFTVLDTGPARLLAINAGELAREPGRYLATLATALRIAAPGLRGGLRGLAYFAEAMVVRSRCRERRISHIHATQFADGAATVALLAAHGGDARTGTWSLTVHGPAELSEVRRFSLAEKVERADFTVAVSEYTRSQLMSLVDERHWGRIHVVHMGVDLARFTVRERPPRSGGEARVLSVARLVRHKGHAVLLRALASLREQGLTLATTIAGDGEERRSLEALRDELGLADQVVFLGAVGQDRLPDLYGEADIFCLPTLAEAVGVVNMEAMASGLAVVSSRLMGVPELIDDGAGGLLTTPGRVDELAAALRRLAEDPELRARLGAAGRERVEADFDAAREAAKLGELLSSVQSG